MVLACAHHRLMVVLHGKSAWRLRRGFEDWRRPRLLAKFVGKTLARNDHLRSSAVIWVGEDRSYRLQWAITRRRAPLYALIDQAYEEGLPLGAIIEWHINYEILVAPSSLYVLRGPARFEFQHQVVPVKIERYSVTFRQMCNPRSFR